MAEVFDEFENANGGATAVTDASEKAEVEVLTESEKCPNCGNNLKFNPALQKLHCEYCDSSFDIAGNSNYVELDLRQGMVDEKDWSDVTRTFECSNCGAQIILSKNESATSCPFCSTPHVVDKKEFSGLKPNVVVPFIKTPDEASASLKKWAKKKFFAPTKFKKKFTADNLNGVYMPCFTFDSNTFSTYYGRIGDRRTRTVGSGKNRRTETYIVWRNISGSYSYFFNDIMISASDKLTPKNIGKMGGFSEEHNKVYEDKYLLGFMAYGKNREIGPCWEDAKAVIDSNLKSLILSQYHYDVVDYIKISTNHNDLKYKLELVPVYVGNYKFGKKVYNFMSNGTNGKCDGKTPVSPVKVSIFSIVLAGIIGVLYWLLFM